MFAWGLLVPPTAAAHTTGPSLLTSVSTTRTGCPFPCSCLCRLLILFLCLFLFLFLPLPHSLYLCHSLLVQAQPLGQAVPFRFSRRHGASSVAPRDRVSPHGPSWSRVTPHAEGALSCPPRPPSCGGPTPGCAARQAGAPSLGQPPSRSEGTEWGSVSAASLCSCIRALGPAASSPGSVSAHHTLKGHRAAPGSLRPCLAAHTPLWRGDSWLCSLATGGRRHSGLGDGRAASPRQ